MDRNPARSWFRPATTRTGDWFGHPRALSYLFGIELWERFSFYGLQALLVLYLQRNFALSAAQALVLFSSYSAVAAITVLIGGVLGDTLLGLRRVALCGIVLLVAGHAMMALESPMAGSAVHPALHPPGPDRSAVALNRLIIALSLISVGVGCVKSSVAALVGNLYEDDDPRRDAGFTLYYVAINIGSLIAPLACGAAGELLGWSYGFGLAALGMLVGLAILVRGYAIIEGRRKRDKGSVNYLRGPRRNWLVALGGLAASVIVAWALIQRAGALLGLCTVGCCLLVGYFAVASARAGPGSRRRRLSVFLILMAFATLFWTLSRLIGGVTSLFTATLVSRDIHGFTIPASTLQSLDPVSIILLAPLVTWAWTAARKALPRLSDFFKMGFGIAITGCSVLLLDLGIRSQGPVVPLIWLVAYYILNGVGELCVMPIGIALVTRLLPDQSGLAVACWYFTSSIGVLIAGYTGSLLLTGGGPHGIELSHMADQYARLFALFGIPGLAGGALLALCGGRLARAGASAVESHS